MTVRVQHEDFDVGAEIARLRADARVGAIAAFVGVVRDLNDNAEVAAMTLGHYPGMTEKALTAIVEEARTRWRVFDVLVVHRIGELKPTDPIVLVIVTSAHQENLLSALVDSTARYGRISSTMGDVGLYIVQKKNIALNQFVSENIDSNMVEFKITGTGHLLDRNMSYLSKSLLYGLLISVGLIGLIMGLLYRSAKMVIIALIVNILPLIMIAALLGFSGVDLKVSTAIIFTISFGIAVDDTLHFMNRFKLELNKGRSYLYALKRTFLSTGKAIVLTSVILCAGFLLLMFSDFLGTFYVGLLIRRRPPCSSPTFPKR